VSTVFLVEAEGSPAAGDDAGRAAYFPLDALPRPLAFDHEQILEDVSRYRASGVRPVL
jgi:8-oxo-dGTP diphosphatase